MSQRSPASASSESSSERQKWTPEQDRILSAAVAQVSAQGETINWHQVAAYLPGRTNKNCRKRWHYKVANDFRKGPWTPDEDDRLRSAVSKHGTKWSKVSQDVKTRNGDQCWKRWNDSLDPQIDHSPWSAEEDAALLKQVEKRGTNWSEIVSHHFPGRTALSAKNRHVLLQRRAEYGLYGRPSSKRSRYDEPANGSMEANGGADQSLEAQLQSGAFGSGFYGPESSTASIDWSQYDMGSAGSLNMGQDAYATPNSIYSTSGGGNTCFSAGTTSTFSTDPFSFPGGDFPDVSLSSPLDLQGMMDHDFDFSMKLGESLLDSQKIIHVRATCESGRLGNVMRDLSRGVNGMVITGDIKDVRYSVE